MKKTLLITAFVAVLFAVPACAQTDMQTDNPIQWKTIEQASQTDFENNDKLIFIDFYTSWCGWCKRMDRETFQDPTVEAILNQFFIPVHFNAEGSETVNWKGKVYQPQMANGRPNAHGFARAILGSNIGYPSFALFSPDGSLIQILQGYQAPGDFQMILWYFASGDNVRYPFETYQEIFESQIKPVMNKRLGFTK